MSQESKVLCEFGEFRFDPAERSLWRTGQAVALAPKALDTLAVLLRKRGRLVEKEELLKAVWPDAFVEEGNLAVQISLLRKTLGDDTYIETIPKRGYRFKAPVREVTESAVPIEPAAVETAAHSTQSRRWIMGTGLAAAGSGVAVGVYLLTRLWSGARIPVRSMAVLPFQVLQGRPEDEGLGLGLADAVITRLGGLNKFTVRPTSAVRQFDQPARDLVAAGTKLGVEAVLDATIQSSGETIRLNAQLVRVSDGRHLWAGTFDFSRADLFTLEDQLSRGLAQAMFNEQVEGSNYRPNPDAHRLVTLGRYYRNRWNTQGQRKAIELADEVIALDPRYAEAHALKGGAWTLLGYLLGAPPREAFPKAEESARIALGLNEKLSDAYHTLGVAKFFFSWNFPAAEQTLRRALDLNSSNPDALHVAGLLEAVRHGGHGGGEGIGSMKRALEIDPASPWRHVGMTFLYASANRIDAAIGEAKTAHELDPRLGAPMYDLYNLYMISGDHRNAVAWSLKQVELMTGGKEYAQSMGEIFEKRGIRAFLEARIARYLEQAAKGVFSQWMMLAQQYIYLGKPDEALRSIQAAVEERQSTVVFINRHPMYASLRSHPGFQAVVRSVGL